MLKGGFVTDEREQDLVVVLWLMYGASSEIGPDA